MTDRAGTALNQDRLTVDGTIEHHRAMGGQKRNAKTGRVGHIHPIGQIDDVFGAGADIFCRGPEGAHPLAIHQPDPLSDPARINPVTDSIDHPGTIALGNDQRERDVATPAAQAGLPVRRVYP